ncbi:hypothetical protein NLX86_24095 [Streptomyces sp. A3M-1-3]|uniref:hypothetical protein n=1 Tax=Streptomyces sp. A3M-1-3 TaxID=2962044 RepID=UPI0020B8A7D9|nr:hypothetical protein [Streptomyces sp. A3M-1-3]MCP3821063.1 hypothetical protein [Streptomyces sp. A3M-1-3]
MTDETSTASLVPEVNPFAPPAEGGTPETAAPGPTADRRALRAALRWTAAVLAFGALGGGVAYGIAAQERADVPGLSTRDDGRWAYPKLTKPVLPAGATQPFDKENPGQVHYADLGDLLLPAPGGARPDKALQGEKGRVPVDRFLSEYEKEERADLKQDLTDGGLRHVVARGWTMPDSTSTRIYLLRFHTAAYAEQFAGDHLGGDLEAVLPVNGVDESAPLDEQYPTDATVPSTDRDVYDEAAPRGPQHVRHAYIRAGDTFALIVQSRKGTANAVPFHQTVVLQNQLLG